MKYKWIFNDQPTADFLSQYKDYSPIVLSLLLERNLDTKEKIEDFFNPKYDNDIHDPFLLKGMSELCERIKKAIDKKEKIVIYSDYDVDGVCSGTILSEFFRKLDYPFEVYIPDRLKEGHGLNQQALETLVNEGANLVITIDCGTTNAKEISWAKEKGVDVIVIDHHQVIGDNPPAAVFVNQHQVGDSYPFKGLCGAGLAFKVYCALISFFNKEEASSGKEKWLLDLVALATVADMMPLLGENRVFVKYGLVVLARTKRNGLKKLLESARIKATYDLETLTTNLDAATLGFSLGPRINAASRMAHGSLAYDLLNLTDEEKVNEIASSLDSNNKRRQQITDKVLKAVKASILNRSELASFIVEGSEEWSVTLLGLVASKVTDAYYRPTLLFEKRPDGICKSSLRSIEGFNLIDALASVSEHLVQYGGHTAAAGCSFKAENEEIVREKLNEYAKKVLTPELLQKKIKISSVINLGEIDWALMDSLRKFEPFGMANPKPKFLSKEVQVTNLVLLGQNAEHLKIFVTELKTKKTFPVLFFRHNGLAEDFKIGDTLDVVYELDINEWNGNKEIQLKLIDYVKK